MKENSIRRAVPEGRAALGTGLKEFASRGVPWIIEAAGFDYCAIDHEHGAFDMETIANLASWFQATNVSAIVRDVSTYLDGMKARAARAHARLKSIGVPTP